MRRLVLLVLTALLVAPACAQAAGVVFESSRTGDAELWRADLDGGALQRLTTSPGVDVQPSVSPDGRTVVFMSRRSGAPRIWTVGIDGTNPRMLTSGPGTDQQPAWSPDGRRIAFVSDRAGAGAQVQVMQADGTQVQALTASAGANGAPAWSPDGRQIAFLTTRDLGPDGDRTGEVYVMNADGTGQRNVSQRAGSESAPAWSPDGGTLIFGRDVGGLWRLNLATSGLTQLTTGPADADPAPTADGQILFTGTGPAPDPDADPVDPNVDVYRLPSAGGAPVRLTTPAARDANPAWAPSVRAPGWDPELADPCSGTTADGRGATSAAALHGRWIADFTASACGTAATLTYDDGSVGPAAQGQGGVGSAAGRIALGQTAEWNTQGVRHDRVRWAGVTQPPTSAQRADIEDGVSGAADDGQLRTIPTAVLAVAVIVNVPNGCVVPTGLQYRPSADGTGRLAVDQYTWGAAWAGQITTWGELAPGITGSGCAARAVRRVVRRDSAGTTAILKRWLGAVDPDAGWDARLADPANTGWPLDAGASAVVRPPAAGDAAVAQTVAATDGAIGYGELGAMRSGGFEARPGTGDDTYWVPMQNGNDDYADPQAFVNGYRVADAARRGANCANATFTGVPTDTRADWSAASAASSSRGYPLCGLTYILAFDDACDAYGDTLLEEQRARTVADYAAYVVSGDGQQLAAAADLAPLPPAIRTKAVGGADALGWRRAGGTCV